jgi:hypothetical protein
MFRLQQHYRIEETEGPGSPWRVEVVEYYYSVHDAEEREVLLYHWHPRGSSSATSPHLHLISEIEALELRIAHGVVPSQVIHAFLPENQQGCQPPALQLSHNFLPAAGQLLLSEVQWRFAPPVSCRMD